jgi:hypothetical protein
MQLEAPLAEPQPALEVITLHPLATTRYLQQIERLSVTQRRTLQADSSSVTWFRGLVERVIVHPVSPRARLDIELSGYLAQPNHRTETSA